MRQGTLHASWTHTATYKAAGVQRFNVKWFKVTRFPWDSLVTVNLRSMLFDFAPRIRIPVSRRIKVSPGPARSEGDSRAVQRWAKCSTRHCDIVQAILR